MTAPVQWSQHSQRVSEDANHSGKFFRDPFGRDWHAEVEIKTGSACSPFKLANPRHAPLAVEGQYIKEVVGRRGQSRVDYDIWIDWDRWRNDIEQAWKDRDVLIARLKTDFPHLTESQIQVKAGQPNLHPRVIVEASKGNPYLLGLRPFDPNNAQDVWLKNYVDPKPAEDDYSWLGDTFPSGADVEEDTPGDDRGERIRAMRAAGMKWADVAVVMKLSETRCQQLAKEPAPDGVPA